MIKTDFAGEKESFDWTDGAPVSHSLDKYML